MAANSGWRKLAAGVFVAPDGALHISIPDMLEARGWEATPANIEEMTEAARRICQVMGIELTEHD